MEGGNFDRRLEGRPTAKSMDRLAWDENFEKFLARRRSEARAERPTAGDMKMLAWAANKKARDALEAALEKARAAAANGKFALKVEAAEGVDELALQSALARLGFGCKVFYGFSGGAAKMEMTWR